jgi:hypothetical protein
MGYFSNGTEGECYYEEYCDRCIHNDANRPYCMVWQLHKEMNYDECNKPESILHRLIPRSEDGMGNKRCVMFIPAPSIGFDFNTSGEQPC